jgi:hypothetical protein
LREQTMALANQKKAADELKQAEQELKQVWKIERTILSLNDHLSNKRQLMSFTPKSVLTNKRSPTWKPNQRTKTLPLSPGKKIAQRSVESRCIYTNLCRNKAANELAQLKAENPMPLRKAKITQEAALRKVEKQVNYSLLLLRFVGLITS